MHAGGAERVAALLCNAWASAGHDVVLMPTYSNRGDCVYLLDRRVSLEFLADVVGVKTNKAGGRLLRFVKLRGYIKGFDPHVVISFLTHVNVVAILASAGMRIPVIVSERAYPPKLSLHWGWSVMRRVTYRRASSVVAQTNVTKDWLERHCPGSNVEVIPNPIVLPLPECEPVIHPRTAVAPDRKLMLAVGRLAPEKNFTLLLDVFARLVKKFPQWDMAILGEGPERQSLEAKWIALGLQSRVFMPGRVGNVGAWYKRADLYVMSSLYEGFPNTLLEAMAHGAPPVSFDCQTGPSEIIHHGQNGLLVPLAGGADGLVSELEGLMTNESRRKFMGKAAEDVRRRFEMAKIETLWDKMIEACVASDKP